MLILNKNIQENKDFVNQVALAVALASYKHIKI